MRVLKTVALLAAFGVVAFSALPQGTAAPSARGSAKVLHTAGKQTSSPPGDVPNSAAAAKRPMELADVLAWKSTSMALVSTDGRWFAYRVAPLDGDAEIVIRQTQDDREYRFVIGDVRGGGGSFAFSEDARWAAMVIAPTKKEAAQLRKSRRPLQNKVALVSFSNGTDVKFEKVRRFVSPIGDGGNPSPCRRSPGQRYVLADPERAISGGSRSWAST